MHELHGAGSFWKSTLYGRSLIPQLSVIDESQPALADFFSDPREYDQVFQSLLKDGELKNHILHVENRDATTRFISLSAVLVHDDNSQPAYISGLMEDVTTTRKLEAGREAFN